MPMVSWQTFVRLGFRVAEDKGAQFQDIQQGGDFIEGLSTLWQNDKQRLKQMTERQAVNYLQQYVQA